MDALSITTEQAIAQTSQSLQLQSIAFNTKRAYCHAVTHFLNWCDGIDRPAQITGDIDECLVQIATRFHDTPITSDQINGYLAHLHLREKSPASIATALTGIKFIARHTGTPIDFLPADTTLKGIKRNIEAQARGRGQATGIKVDDAMTMATIADSPRTPRRPPAKRHPKRRTSDKPVMRLSFAPCPMGC